MTEPARAEQESAPSLGRAAVWLAVLIMLVAGLLLYAFYGNQVQPLIELESAR